MGIETVLLIVLLAVTAPLWGPFAFLAAITVLSAIVGIAAVVGACVVFLSSWLCSVLKERRRAQRRSA